MTHHPSRIQFEKWEVHLAQASDQPSCMTFLLGYGNEWQECGLWIRWTFWDKKVPVDIALEKLH